MLRAALAQRAPEIAIGVAHERVALGAAIARHGRLMPKTLRRPVRFEALDLEGLSKAVPTVVCPVQSDRMNVDGCAHCADFRRVELDDRDHPVVRCRGARARREAHASTREVLEVLRVPGVCLSPDSPALALLPYLELEPPSNIIPILDRDARPVGVVDCAALRRELSSGFELDAPLRETMSTVFAAVLPNTRVCDAASQRPDAGFRGVLVVTHAGTLVGVVHEPEFDV